jgi:ATP-dependent DNA helicase PIF1
MCELGAVHTRFLAEKRATIVNLGLGLRLLLSGAPPADLARMLDLIVAEKTPRGASIAASEGKTASPEWRKQLRRPAEETAQTARLLSVAVDSPEGTSKREVDEGVMSFTREQREVIKAIASGKSVFFTGAAGCGKSVLLRRIIGLLPRATTAVTASTGVAACNVGGTTVMAFAGVGNPEGSVEEMVRAVSRNHETVTRWRRTKVLIIDEVSMLDGDTFDRLEAVARRVRGGSEPFGGVQLVMTGDFLQLPPVSKSTTRKPYAFEARSWKAVVQREMELTRVFRQGDHEFAEVLNQLRWGIVSERASEMLRSRWGARVSFSHGVQATHLLSHRADVDRLNARELDALPLPECVHEADDSSSGELPPVGALESMFLAPKSLRLRVGAQVMLIKNIDVHAGLVNGARGVITELVGSLQYPRVQFLSGKDLVLGRETFVTKQGNGGTVTRKQFPLRLAFAISVHKSQGMTLDAVELSLSRVFENGQSYVALSRVRSLEGLCLSDRFEPTMIKVCPVASAFHATLRRARGLSVPTDTAEPTTSLLDGDKASTSSPDRTARRRFASDVSPVANRVALESQRKRISIRELDAFD